MVSFCPFNNDSSVLMRWSIGSCWLSRHSLTPAITTSPSRTTSASSTAQARVSWRCATAWTRTRSLRNSSPPSLHCLSKVYQVTSIYSIFVIEKKNYFAIWNQGNKNWINKCDNNKTKMKSHTTVSEFNLVLNNANKIVTESVFLMVAKSAPNHPSTITIDCTLETYSK